MFDLKKKNNQFVFIAFGLQVVLIPWKKKRKTNYYAKKSSVKFWVSL